MDVSAFLEAFTCWVSIQPDVKAVALVGSYARDAITVAAIAHGKQLLKLE